MPSVPQWVAQTAYLEMCVQKILAHLIKALMERNSAVNAHEIEDDHLGLRTANQRTGLQHRSYGRNLVGLLHTISAQTVNRLCGSSMTAVHEASNAIKAGNGDIFICGGVYTRHIPMTHGVDINPALSLHVTQFAGMMGITAEALGSSIKYLVKIKTNLQMSPTNVPTKPLSRMLLMNSFLLKVTMRWLLNRCRYR